MKPGKLGAQSPAMKLYDNDFVAFARLAAKAFRGIAGSLQVEANQGLTRALVTRLRSGAGLDPEECEVIADLISGELCRRVGRPAKNAIERQRRRDIYSRYHQIMKQYRSERPRGTRALAIQKVVSEYAPITTAQVEAILRDKKMR